MKLLIEVVVSPLTAVALVPCRLTLPLSALSVHGCIASQQSRD